MSLLGNLQNAISGKLIKPVQDDLKQTDWGTIDTVVKVEPSSILMLSVAVIVVFMVVVYYKKNV
jgi:hypothetical protein